MGEAKTFASLSSGLLARKGHAKPAMRPQGSHGVGASIASHDDLGWNDMGHDHPTVPVSTLPPVIRQQAEIAQEFARVPVEPTPPLAEPPVAAPLEAEAAIEPEPATVAPVVPVSRARNGAGAKAAFTLRLDTDRHLKLRLACAVAGRSAQQMVTEALDAFLATLPALDALAGMAPDGAAGDAQTLPGKDKRGFRR